LKNPNTRNFHIVARDRPRKRTARRDLQIGVRKIFRADPGQIFCVEQIHHRTGLANGCELYHGIARPCSVDVFIQTIVEQIVAVAAARVRRTKPDSVSNIRVGVFAPRHVMIPGQVDHLRQLNIPTGVGGRICRIRRTFRRQKILIIRGVKLHCHAPLFEIVQTGRRLGLGLGLAEHGQKHRRQNGDDGNYHQQFNQCECAKCLHALQKGNPATCYNSKVGCQHFLQPEQPTVVCFDWSAGLPASR
jgi:hypothetical protein